MNPAVALYAHTIVVQARSHGLQPSIVAGLMDVEDPSGDPKAISPTQAVGLMQVEPAEVIPGRPTTQQLFDPETNIRTGCEILAGNFTAYGTTSGMLAAYYGAVDSQGHPTGASDGSGVTGWGYVQRVEASAKKYVYLDQYTDDDFLQYAPSNGSWREACINLKGICDDALRTGRDVVSRSQQAAVDITAVWNNR